MSKETGEMISKKGSRRWKWEKKRNGLDEIRTRAFCVIDATFDCGRMDPLSAHLGTDLFYPSFRP